MITELLQRCHSTPKSAQVEAPTRTKEPKRGWKSMRATFGVLITLGLLMAMSGCSTGVASGRDEAKTGLKLIDVTSASFETTDSDGDTTTFSRDTESFWRNPENEEIIRCLHDTNSDLTAEAKSCESFPRAAQLSNSTNLLAINMGYGYGTQSVWEDDGVMSICNHNIEPWSGKIEPTKECSSFERPESVSRDAVLTALNSGINQMPQTFWNNKDRSVTQCTHEKQNTGFLGLGDKLFGKAATCGPLEIPADKFPPEIESPVLAGVTSDDNREMESFWQDADGILIRCKHDKVGGFFQDKQIGKAQNCELWKAPKLN